MSTAICTVSWCERPVIARGLCAMHRMRERLGIDMDAPVQRRTSAQQWEQWRPEMTRLRQEGQTSGQIATAFSLGVTSVEARLRSWGVSRPQAEVPHGTTSGWSWWKCRCEECLAARKRYKRQERAERQARANITAEHGTTRAYEQGCQCADCRGAAAAATRERNEATRPGARRHGAKWTGADAAIAFRDDITIAERAAILGRTYASVDNFIRAQRRRPDDPYGVKG